MFTILTVFVGPNVAIDAEAITYIRDITATAKLLEQDDVDAIEIHTNGR